ncbi:hypothetical protein [Amycolatopsis sp. NPDC059657]|uniref:hypothetical protein n=1 Tax=Amycolatopsis sp. NPDC059657 TaxID=3346899 RepID=UPI00366C7D30
MNRTTAPSRAAVLILTWIGATIGHDGGDYLVQRDSDAQVKQARTRAGRTALAVHCLTYGATQAAAKAVLYRAAGVRVPLRAQLAGGLAEILLHAVIDDGRLLRAYARVVGKLPFHDLAAAGVNGRMLLDQAAHRSVQIPVGTLITTAMACSSRT